MDLGSGNAASAAGGAEIGFTTWKTTGETEGEGKETENKLAGSLPHPEVSGSLPLHSNSANGKIPEFPVSLWFPRSRQEKEQTQGHHFLNTA